MKQLIALVAFALPVSVFAATAAETDRQVLDGIATDLAAVKTDLAAVKTDLATAKADLATVKRDVETAKADLATVKQRLGEPRKEPGTGELPTLAGELVDVAGELADLKSRGQVAVIRVQASTNPLDREGDFLVNPIYYIQGSTIPGFHESARYNADITNANSDNQRTLHSRQLPKGRYLVELEQPRPAVETGCASDTYGFACEPMRFVIGKPVPGHPGNVNKGSELRRPDGQKSYAAKVFRHAAVVYVGELAEGRSGTELSHFFVAFAIKPEWVTTTRSAGTFVGKVKITKLQ